MSYFQIRETDVLHLEQEAVFITPQGFLTQVRAPSQQSTPRGSARVPGTQRAAQESQTSDHLSWKDNVGGKAKMLLNLSGTPRHTKLEDFL